MDPLLQEIGKALAAYSPQAYFVGGCVRDLLMGAPIKDLDVAITGDTQALGRDLANRYRGHVFWLREEEGVARVLLPACDNLQIDLCPLRGTLEEDLLSRDLTINAMAVPAADGLSACVGIIDPAGGRSDLAARVVRFVRPSAPERDPLRTLRALRFRWKLGFDLEPATAERIRECVPLLERVSGERIRDELFQLIAMPAAASAVAECLGYGMGRWLTGSAAPIPVEIGGPASAERLGAMQVLFGNASPDLLRVLEAETTPPRRRREVLLWAAALEPLTPHLDPSAAARHLALSSDERQLIEKGLASAPAARKCAEGWPVAGRERYRMFRAAGPAGPEAVLLAAARDGWSAAYAELLDESLERYHHPQHPLLTGTEVMRILGIGPGPGVGRALEEVEEARADGELHTADEAALWLQQRISG